MSDMVEFELVTPQKLMASKPVHMVVVPGGEGDFGVLPGHTPMVTTVRPGMVEIYGEAGKVTQRLFVEGGFAEVTGERCTLLAEVAISSEDLSRDVAEKRLADAKAGAEKAGDGSDAARAKLELEIAEAQLQAVDSLDKGRGH